MMVQRSATPTGSVSGRTPVACTMRSLRVASTSHQFGFVLPVHGRSHGSCVDWTPERIVLADSVGSKANCELRTFPAGRYLRYLPRETYVSHTLWRHAHVCCDRLCWSPRRLQ